MVRMMFVLLLLIVISCLCDGVELNRHLGVTYTSDPQRDWAGLAMDYSGQHIVATAYQIYSEDFSEILAPGAMYTSDDFGESWNLRHNLTTYQVLTNSSGQLIISVGVDCLYISTDFGATITNVSFHNITEDILHIAMSSSGVIVYLADSIGTVFRSNDSGFSWYNISYLPNNLQNYGIDCNDNGSFVLYSKNGGIYTSFDYGETFTFVSTFIAESISLDATGQYVVSSGTNSNGFYRSTDYGKTFTLVSNSIPGQFTASSQDGYVLYGTASYYPLYVSFSAGSNWTTANAIKGFRTLACNAKGTIVAAGVNNGGLGGSIYVMTEQAPPTSMPSSPPSSRPSCQFGDGSNDNAGGCTTCAPGSYVTSLGGVCEVCPVGYYTSDYGESECHKCKYPTKSVFDDSSSCNGWSIGANITTTLIVMGALAFVVLLCVLNSVKKAAVIVNLIFPTLDLFSDVAYLMANDFYSPILFALGVLFVIFPLPGFLYTVYKEKAVVPRLTWRLEKIWWLSAGNTEQDHFYYAKFPCFGGDERFPILSCVKHDNLCSLTLEGVVWVIAIVSQVLTIVLYPFVIVCNVLFLFAWIFVGMFLYLSKTLTIGNVWNMWFRVWTGSNDHDTDVDVDTEALNGSLQHEFYFETIPQVALQLVNNILLKEFSTVAIVSLVQSLVMALNGIWRFGYYRYVVKDPLPLKDIPIDMTIRLRIESLGIDMTLFDGKIEPRSRKEGGSGGNSGKSGLKAALLPNVVVDDDGKKVEPNSDHNNSSGRDSNGNSKKNGGVVVEGVGAVIDIVTSVV